MKRNGAILILISLLSIIGFLMLRSFVIIKRSEEVKRSLFKLKAMPLVDMDSLKFYLPVRKPLFIIFFSSDCHNCHSEIDDIKENINEFSNYNIVLVSNEPLLVIREFASQRALTNENLYITKIKEEDTFIAFGSLRIPHTLVYGADSVLKAEFKGLHSARAMLKTLK